MPWPWALQISPQILEEACVGKTLIVTFVFFVLVFKIPKWSLSDNSYEEKAESKGNGSLIKDRSLVTMKTTETLVV